MARFEGALAEASACAGLVPEAAAKTIAQVAAAAEFDVEALAPAARRAGTLTIPFVKQLTAESRRQSRRRPRATCTSAPPARTRWTLVWRSASIPAADRLLVLSKRLGDAAAVLAKRHARTPTVSRTLLQPAVPVPFGWKAAVWLSMIARAHAGFRAAARAASVLQLRRRRRYAIGLRRQGRRDREFHGQELGLARAPVTWHSARDGFARLGAEAAILAGTAGKIARDVSLLMQPEVGEASEPAGAGRGGSSAMPHKRNPVGCLAALEAAQRAPGLAATLLDAARARARARPRAVARPVVHAARPAVQHGRRARRDGGGARRPDRSTSARCARTSIASRGLVYSENVSLHLSRTLGKQAAHALTEKLCETAVREGKTAGRSPARGSGGKVDERKGRSTRSSIRRAATALRRP